MPRITFDVTEAQAAYLEARKSAEQGTPVAVILRRLLAEEMEQEEAADFARPAMAASRKPTTQEVSQ